MRLLELGALILQPRILFEAGRLFADYGLGPLYERQTRTGMPFQRKMRPLRSHGLGYQRGRWRRCAFGTSSSGKRA